MNARECSIRAARDQITHRDVEGFIRSLLLVFFKRLYLLFLQSVLYPALMKRCVCRVLIFILNGISGAQLLWSVFISTKKILFIYTSLIMNVAYSIVHIHRPGRKGTLASDLKGARELFQSLGAKYEKVLPPLVDFAIRGTTKSPELCSLGSGLIVA